MIFLPDGNQGYWSELSIEVDVKVRLGSRREWWKQYSLLSDLLAWP